ncbi:MAG: phosphoribosylglycinamide formyltransferase [Thermoplasmata archaeon]
MPPTPSFRPPIALGVLVSGEGRTLEGLGTAIAEGRLAARIALVVSDRAQAPAIDRAHRRGWPVEVIPPRGTDRGAWGEAVTRRLEAAGVELVVLAGFLRVLPASWAHRWAGRAVNLHPSLLPAYGGPGYYGLKVHEAVIADGVRETGATVHWVTDEVDRGPILGQRRIAVRPGETAHELAARLRPVEIALLVEVLNGIALGRLSLPPSA